VVNCRSRICCQIEIFGKDWIVWKNIEIFWKRLKFLAKIEIFGYDWIFWKILKFLANIQIFGKSEIFDKTVFFGKTDICKTKILNPTFIVWWRIWLRIRCLAARVCWIARIWRSRINIDIWMCSRIIISFRIRFFLRIILNRAAVFCNNLRWSLPLLFLGIFF